MKLLPILLACVTAVIPSATLAAGGYLFVFFTGEHTPMSEQVYFALSKDGRRWETLNNRQPVLVTDIGEKGARDPFILRSRDGKSFHLIATDLSIHHNGDWNRAQNAASQSILVWNSPDLVEWTGPNLVKVAADDAGCAWAPEAIHDVENDDYLVFWASRNRRDDFAKQRIWAARTKDFATFGEAFIYIEKPNHVIDTTIIREIGRYFRFSKDEQHKALTMEAGDRLTGPWEEVPGFTLARLQGYEGPQAYVLEPATADKPAVWALVIDHYARGRGYQPYITTDLASGVFTEAADFHFPERFRHGSILRLTAEEYDRVLARFGNADEGENSQP